MLGLVLPTTELQANENLDEIIIEFEDLEEIYALPGQLFNVSMRRNLAYNTTLVIYATIFSNTDGTLTFHSVEEGYLEKNERGIHLVANIERTLSSNGRIVTVYLTDVVVMNYIYHWGTYDGSTIFNFWAQHYPN